MKGIEYVLYDIRDTLFLLKLCGMIQLTRYLTCEKSCILVFFYLARFDRLRKISTIYNGLSFME